MINFLLEKFEQNAEKDAEKDAIVWKDHTYSYKWLFEAVTDCMKALEGDIFLVGSVVSLEADFSPKSVAMMIALIQFKCIIVPLTKSVESKKNEFKEIAEVEVVISIDNNDLITISKTNIITNNEKLIYLKTKNHPGLVLFSSGSTGKSKAAVHDFIPLLEKFKISRYAKRTITFLLFDHIGGVNTLLYTLSNAGCVITVHERTPDKVCEAIEKYRVQNLPTSPTFINLLLISGALERYDLSSLELITYGTEVMPESTLLRFNKLHPNVQLLQTYGLSEVGILRSKSKSSESLWVKVGGEGFETRVIDGMLEIKAQSAMLGYLNAPSPFTEDGWFKTGDAVEVDGEYIKILGRKSEIINVGGEKVYPVEVESVLQMMDGIEDVSVSAEAHPITGQIVKARVKLKDGVIESISVFRKRMRVFCQDKLDTFKIPQKVVFVDHTIHGERFKKMRRE